MEFDPRKDELEEAAGYRLSPEIMMRRGLVDQQEMFYVMPELNPERDHPPGMRAPGKAFSEYPNADQHDQGVAIMQRFGLNQPRIPQTEQAQSLRARPSHDIDLVSLNQMLRPMTEHNHHKDLQRALMPTGIELLVKAGVIPCRTMNVGDYRIRDCHYCPSPWTHFEMCPRSHLGDGGSIT